QTGGQATCPAGWGMLMIVINNIISFLLTLAIVFIAPLMIAYAGFLMVVNPTSLGDVSKARSILTNTVIGIVVALAAWLIVDAVMAVLYNQGAKTADGSALGVWSDLVTSGGAPLCIQQTGSAQAPPSGGVVVSGALNPPPSGKTGTACDPAAVQAGAQTGGYTLSTTQANILACIAQPESSCGTTLQNYNWGNGSSAYGAFQVLLSTNSSCYENKACYTAAKVTGPLNCASGFSGGNPIPGSPVVQLCMTAAANLSCSASAAACLLANNGGSFSPWQPAGNSTAQTACITNGG
ncbi:MAG: hypothetical protein KGI71_01630, partial [Patescibacteria group bacterium]|nr:hypothetical protein [Patescibacteria group bacterium]